MRFHVVGKAVEGGRGQGDQVSRCFLCLCMCWCPETRRLVQLTDPAPLSFWKNPAMAIAEETGHPAYHSAGGGSRR
jgi:hypothetical protein